MKQFTLEELKKFNGKGGKRAYVAYKGKIYDVSHSFLWQNGEHQVTHSAGEDLSPALEKAPHGVDLLEKFPVVGVLKKG
ncbi:MAG: cytochrome B5 [Methanobacteriaceae archaeon]|jgi:predicted heme/steroid binding protein|nr:MAG: cytochrome B5 [Methanobacterium sp. BRmetb2]MCC7557922.1 cytochrome B5 [Methanobacteriaceae archaeon]